MCSACEGQPWPWTLLVGASFWTYAESVERVAWPRLLFFGGHWCGTQCIAQGNAWASRSWHFATGWRLGQKKHKIDLLVFCVASDPTSDIFFLPFGGITNMNVKLPKNLIVHTSSTVLWPAWTWILWLLRSKWRWHRAATCCCPLACAPQMTSWSKVEWPRLFPLLFQWLLRLSYTLNISISSIVILQITSRPMVWRNQETRCCSASTHVHSIQCRYIQYSGGLPNQLAGCGKCSRSTTNANKFLPFPSPGMLHQLWSGRWMIERRHRAGCLILTEFNFEIQLLDNKFARSIKILTTSECSCHPFQIWKQCHGQQ